MCFLFVFVRFILPKVVELLDCKDAAMWSALATIINSYYYYYYYYYY